MNADDQALKAKGALWRASRMALALADIRPDDHGEALADLLVLMADWLAEQADGMGPGPSGARGDRG